MDLEHAPSLLLTPFQESLSESQKKPPNHSVEKGQFKAQRTRPVLFTFPDSESFPPFVRLALSIWVWAHPALWFPSFLSCSGFEYCPGCVTVAGDETLVGCQQNHPWALLDLAKGEVGCCCCICWGRVSGGSPESHHTQPHLGGEWTDISSPSAGFIPG